MSAKPTVARSFLLWYRKNSVKIHVDSLLATLFSAIVGILVGYTFSSSEAQFILLSNAVLHIVYVPLHLLILYVGDMQRFSSENKFSPKKLGVEYAGVYGTQVSLFFLYNAIAVPVQAYLMMGMYVPAWAAFLIAHMIATFGTRPAHGVLYFFLHRILKKYGDSRR